MMVHQALQSCRPAVAAACVAALLLASAAPAAPNEIVVGQVLPLTGPLARVGEALRQGRLACAEAVNREGGIQGRLLRLVTADDRGDAGRAAELVEGLLARDAAVALLGPVGAAVSQRVLEQAQAERVAVLAPHGGEAGLRARSDSGVFFVTANQSIEAERLVQHLSTVGADRFALVHGPDASSAAARVAFEEALALAGIAPRRVVPVAADGHDADVVAREVAAVTPQAVLLATGGGATAAVLAALQRRQDRAPLLQVYGMSSSVNVAELAQLGTALAGYSMTQVVPTANDPRLPLTAQARAAFALAGVTPGPLEMEGCLATVTLATVMRTRQAGDLTRAGILQALRMAGRVNVGGLEIDLSDSARGARFVEIVLVGPGGRLVR